MGGDAELDGVAQRGRADVLLAERVVGRPHHLRILQQVQEPRAPPGPRHQGWMDGRQVEDTYEYLGSHPLV